MAKTFRALGVLVIVSLSVALGRGFGQSLGELARKQREERAKQSQSPAKVFTNDNIPARVGISEATAESKSTAEPSATPSGEKSSGAASSQAETQPTGSGQAGKEPEKGEKYWRERFAEARRRLERAQRELSVLQQQLNLGQMQYYPDPQKTLEQEYSRKNINDLTDKIKKKQAEVAAQQQALDDLEIELRRAGGEPGWAR